MKSIKRLLDQQVPLLTSWRSKILLIAFLSIITLFFLYVYSPLEMGSWGKKNYIGYVSIGACTLLFSQLVILPLFRIRTLKIYGLLVLCLSEVLLISFIVYLFFSPELSSFQEKLGEYLGTIKYVVLIMLLPYLIMGFYLGFANRTTKSGIEEQNNEDLASKGIEDALLTLTAENGKIILAINYQQLLYAKSAGNYIELYYLNGDTPSKELIRMSLKDFEAKITDSDIVRVHRSYIVNIHRISSYKKVKKGYEIIVRHSRGAPIPVSSGYKDIFESTLKQVSAH